MMGIAQHPVMQILLAVAADAVADGDAERAIIILQEARTIFAHSSEILFRSGLTTSVVNPLQAVPFLSVAKALDPDLASSIGKLERILTAPFEDQLQDWLDLGRELERLAELSLAELAYRRAILIDPGSPDALALLGNILEQEGKGGLSFLHTALQVAPDSILARAEMAVYWQQHSQPTKAITILQSIARDLPSESIWLINIARVYSEMGEVGQAFDHFVMAVNIAPEDATTWLALAGFCLQFNIYIQDVGLPAARNALSLAPYDGEALLKMGQMLLQAGDANSAIRFLERANEMNPNDLLIVFFLAEAYIAADRAAEAYSFYVQIITEAGESSIGSFARDRLERYFGVGAILP